MSELHTAPALSRLCVIFFCQRPCFAGFRDKFVVLIVHWIVIDTTRIKQALKLTIRNNCWHPKLAIWKNTWQKKLAIRKYC